MTPQKANNLTTKDQVDSKDDEIPILELKRVMIRTINEMKKDVHKYLHEIKENKDKQFNEFKQNTNKQLNEQRYK
jgi:DNA anti-recombination protein RmuC